MSIISRWKLRDVTSTVTLLPYVYSTRVSGMHATSLERCTKGPQELIRGYQTSGEAQHGSAGYSYPVIMYGEHDVK